MDRMGVIGTGVVGSAVAILLEEKGYPVTGVYSKRGISASALAQKLGCKSYPNPVDLLNSAEIIFLTVPDRELNGLADLLAESGMVRADHMFFHMSGALSAEVLLPLREKGSIICSFHPLQSFADVEQALINLPGSFFTIQGDDGAINLAHKIIRDLKGEAFTIQSKDKPLYHMGAVIASNYLVSLIHSALSIYGSIGIQEDRALQALLPLIRGTLSNIEQLGPEKALTGPIARGDSGTVREHLMASAKLHHSCTELYKALGTYTVRVASEKGSIDKGQRERLLKILL